MATALHYSSMALARRSGWMLLAAGVVIADAVAHAGGGMPRVLGLPPVPSAVLIATALYLVGSTVVLTLALTGGGGVALATGETGVTVRTAWFSRTTRWSDVARIALDVRYGRSSHWLMIAVHERSGLARCHAVDTRLLAEPLDRAGAWVDAAERERVARGGAPFAAPTTGLAGYNARVHAADITADVAAAARAGAR